MAQEKQQPPLGKAARKGERGQRKGKAASASLEEKEDKTRPKARQASRGIDKENKKPSAGGPPPLAGQLGGPNVRSVRSPSPIDDQASDAPPSSRSDHENDPQARSDRRRAAPARRRFAANDDVPSIGGLIFALQQKPSNRPFVMAGIASVVWAALSLIMVWSVFQPVFADPSTLGATLQSSAALGAIAGVIIPIVLFWFLALLIWRAQELRLMSSAMTEVAVRLAEPDKAAEQSVASLGQSVRRQVTAMNDAISRALGRASELEALVHNEVAALERSYNENESRIKNLIGELAHEREALTKDSERIHLALSGVGKKLTHQIEAQGQKTTQLLEKTSGAVSTKLIESSEKITQSMSEQSNSVVSTMTSMNERVGREMPVLLERMGKEQIKLNKVVEHASSNLSALDQSISHHAGALNNALTDRTQQIEGVFRKHVQQMSVAMDERSQTLDNSLSNKIQTFDNTLIQRMDDFEETLSDTTQKIDVALANKAQYLDMAISSRVAELDSALIERTKVIDAAFTERLQALDNALHKSSKSLDQAFAYRAEELGRSMDARSQYIVQTIGAKTQELDNALMSGAKTLQLTTEDVGKQVSSTIHGLAGQAQLLKEVSGKMQSHVGQMTHSLREQSQMVMQAAAHLENSHDRIGSKLGNSQSNLQKLVESISTRTSDLDHVMASYSSQLESTLTQAEMKAREITDSLHTRSASQSMEALTELTKLRDAATSQTERAILDMKDRISSVSNEMSSQITSLSSEISDTQNHLKQQLQQIPDTTRKSASLMRRTLQDQLKALESLSSLSSGSNNADISSPGFGGARPQAQPPFGDQPPQPGQGLTGHLSQELQTRDTGADRDREIAAITDSLAQRVTDKLDLGAALAAASSGGETGKAAPDSASHWSMGDLLARASENEASPGGQGANFMNANPEATAGSAMPPINIHAIAQLVDPTAAMELWRNYRSGLRTPIGDGVYNDNGDAYRRISGLYGSDITFRGNVDRYISDFERLLAEADQKDPQGTLAIKQLSSESGRVYLLLMHAAGRIGF